MKKHNKAGIWLIVSRRILSVMNYRCENNHKGDDDAKDKQDSNKYQSKKKTTTELKL